jgi:hypothetical protein
MSARRQVTCGIFSNVDTTDRNQTAPILEHTLEGAALEDCQHPATEHLGTNQRAEFLRCELCGAVLVRQGQRLWIVPPRSSPETQAE